jgi:uncharacterized OsmC-like protein
MAREVTSTWKDGYRTEARVGEHRVTIDGLPDTGGTDAGPSPGELLLAALGS